MNYLVDGDAFLKLTKKRYYRMQCASWTSRKNCGVEQGQTFQNPPSWCRFLWTISKNDGLPQAGTFDKQRDSFNLNQLHIDLFRNTENKNKKVDTELGAPAPDFIWSKFRDVSPNQVT
ncbi:20070_t:CDS:2 [Funneliformis geosporum]|uniref:20070_t:CDS:1 n=1 Tax=Funneliformis geosporum TaxID=1117311 RepID=A0A9W4WQ06_9GLOM|nr:20070_t:CDS:2 [Funneliformis geosporum]